MSEFTITLKKKGIKHKPRIVVTAESKNDARTKISLRATGYRIVKIAKRRR